MPTQRDVGKVKTVWKEFPINIDDRLNAVLSGVNTEFKSAALGCYLDDKWKTSNEIEIISKNHLYPHTINPNSGTFKDYCVYTFIPAGLVAEKRIKYPKGNDVSYFKLTEAGEKYGKPIARLSLKTAVESKRSMYEIFGRTASPGKTNSPSNTAKILDILEKQSNIRETDLTNIVGLNNTGIRKHLLNLKEIGFVDYASVSSEETGWSRYEYISGKDPKKAAELCRRQKLANDVAYKIRELGISDCGDIAESLGRNTNNISSTLSCLENHGFIRKITKFSSGKKHSDISITEKGKLFTFLHAVCDVLEDKFDEVNKEIKLFDDYTISRGYISEAFRLYEKVSPALNRKSKEENKGEILEILGCKKMRKREIDEKLHKDSYIYLKSLMDEGIIEKERVSNSTFYLVKT